MMRLLLAASLLLASLAFTCVASSIIHEDPYIYYPVNDCCGHEPECSDLCIPVPKPDDLCGCNVAASIGNPFTLQPPLPPYILGPTNNGRPQPPGGLGLGTPIRNSAGQYVLINRDTFFPRFVDFEEKSQLIIVDTDDKTGQDGIIDEYTENYNFEDEYAKWLNWYSNKGQFPYPPSQQGFGSLSYPDPKPYIKYPSPFRAPGTYPSGQDCRGYHGHEYEQFPPGLEQPKLSPTGIAGSYYPTEDNNNPNAQNDNGYEYLHPNKELFNLLSQALQGSSQYDNDFGQFTRDQKLFPPTVQPGYDYEYNKLLSKPGKSRPPVTHPDTLNTYLKYGYGYEQFSPKPEFPNNPSNTFADTHGYETDDVISSDNFGYQYEQLYPNRDEFKHSSTTVVRKGHSKNTPPFYLSGYEQLPPGQMGPINLYTASCVQIPAQTTNEEGDLPQHFSDYGQYKLDGTTIHPSAPGMAAQYQIEYEQSLIGGDTSRGPFPTVVPPGYGQKEDDTEYNIEHTVSHKHPHDGVPAPHGVGYSYRGHGVSKNPSKDILKTGYPTHHGGVNHGHSPEHITEYKGTYSKEHVPIKHSPKGVSIQHSFEYDNLRTSPVDQSGYQTNVGYKLPTEQITENEQSNHELNGPKEYSPHGIHTTNSFRHGHTGHGISNSPCSTIHTGYPIKTGHGQQSEHITETTQSYQEQNAPVYSPADEVYTQDDLGYEQSPIIQGISNIPSSVVISKAYPTEFGSGIQPEYPNGFAYSYEEQYAPTVLSPDGVLTQQMGFGYEQPLIGQGISNSPSPNFDHTGYPTKPGHGHPTEHKPKNDQPRQEQSVQKVYPPHGIHTKHGLGHEKSHTSHGISTCLPPINAHTGYPTKPSHGHSTDHKPKNDQSCEEQNVSKGYLHHGIHTKHGLEYEKSQSYSEHNAEPSSLPTGYSSQHNFVTEELPAAIQDDHPSKTAPLYEYNENHLPKSQTQFPFSGSPLNTYRPSTNHGLGYIQRHPTEEPSKLPPHVGVHSSWTNGGAGSNKPGHDGSTAKFEAGATKDIPWGAETEVEEQTIKIFDGCSVSYSQLQDIISSFKSPQECMLTVPPIFSGRFDQYAHVMESFPASMDVSDAFVHLSNDLIVPYDCYKHIASVFAKDLPLFQECSGEVFDDGQFVDYSTIASIVASSRSPERRLILTNNNLALPFETYKNYIERISPEDRSTLRVVLPENEKPIPYGTYKQVFQKYVDRLQKDCVLDKTKTIKLLGSKTKLSLEQFMAVINNYHALKDATVTLPSKKTLPLVSFIPLAKVLGDEYTRCCMVSIPNTPHVLPFTVVREIFKLYLEKRTFDLSNDMDVNWKFEGNHRQYNPADVDIFSTLDQESHKDSQHHNCHKEPTTGLKCPHSQEHHHYLLCRPHHLPSCNYCNEAEKAESAGGAIFDGSYAFSSYDKESHSPNHHRSGCAEPVYGCERFEKYVPK